MHAIKARVASLAVTAALLFSSAAAVAAPAPATAAQASQSSWLTLSMLTQDGAIGLAGAAAQPDNTPPPAHYGGAPQTPPIPVIVVWLGVAAMAIYIATLDHRGHGQFPLPNSPG